MVDELEPFGDREACALADVGKCAHGDPIGTLSECELGVAEKSVGLFCWEDGGGEMARERERGQWCVQSFKPSKTTHTHTVEDLLQILQRIFSCGTTRDVSACEAVGKVFPSFFGFYPCRAANDAIRRTRRDTRRSSRSVGSTSGFIFKNICIYDKKQLKKKPKTSEK